MQFLREPPLTAYPACQFSLNRAIEFNYAMPVFQKMMLKQPFEIEGLRKKLDFPLLNDCLIVVNRCRKFFGTCWFRQQRACKNQPRCCERKIVLLGFGFQGKPLQ